FLAVAGVSAFARIQYAVLPLVYLAAAVVHERGRIGEVAPRHRVVLGVTVFGGAAAVLVGHGLLGYYHGVTSLHYRPPALLHWAGTDALLLAYAAGIVLVPAAVTALVQQLHRPSTPESGAFAALVAVFTLAVLGQPSLPGALPARRRAARAAPLRAPRAAPLPLARPARGVRDECGRPRGDQHPRPPQRVHGRA